MTGDIAIALLLDGLIGAAVYTLLAVALILVFSVTRIIFIPQGEFVAYAALSIAAMEAGRVPATLYLLLAAGAAAVAIELAVHVNGQRTSIRSALVWGAALP